MVGDDNGLAPDAQLFSTGYSDTATLYTGIDWLIGQGVNVINMSAGADFGGAYDARSRWVDHIAVNDDVHFVGAAGNSGPDGYVVSPSMAYNAITVGGFDDRNSEYHDAHIWPNPAFPSFEETGSTRPEKPNLVAPAKNIWAISGFESGTSWAAPQVTGTIAQICSYDTALKTKQSAMGAIFAASSARKVQDVTGYGTTGGDFATVYRIEGNAQISEREGAGKLDSRWARGIAYFDHYWSYTIATGSFPYSKTVYINSSTNSYIRVAIFWLRRINESYNEISQFTNLNLTVLNPSGVSVGSSTTTYGNFEIVQFHPTVSGTYTIRITKSGTNNSTQEHVGIAVW